MRMRTVSTASCQRNGRLKRTKPTDTFPSPRPARSYPRLWIRRSSFERRRDFNPPELRAAQRTIGLIDPIALVGRLQKRPAAFVQLRRIGLHPAPNATGVHL